ncbi:MAG: TerB family tellurite resistance protein [Deltaproteobacteria bacterium]|nr:TerB family tellurite resistance protein [Deltaproteobacteria bacterium]
MGFLGKLIGGTVGFAIGGPLGAVAGAVFGHAFDQSNESGYRRDVQMLGNDQAQAQLTFFVGAFSMLAKLVQSDGRVSAKEIDSIERFMAEDLSLDPESRNAARNIFNTAMASAGTFQDYVSQFYNQFRSEPKLLEMMIDIMLRVSVSDGRYSASEEAMILSAVNIFHLGDDTYGKLKARYVDRLEKYYMVLECRESDSDEKIKTNYRRLVSEYHPDKITSKGLPEPFVQFAGDKFREIQEAYEEITRQRQGKA